MRRTSWTIFTRGGPNSKRKEVERELAARGKNSRDAATLMRSTASRFLPRQIGSRLISQTRLISRAPRTVASGALSSVDLGALLGPRIQVFADVLDGVTEHHGFRGVERV